MTTSDTTIPAVRRIAFSIREIVPLHAGAVLFAAKLTR